MSSDTILGTTLFSPSSTIGSSDTIANRKFTLLVSPTVRVTKVASHVSQSNLNIVGSRLSGRFHAAAAIISV